MKIELLACVPRYYSKYLVAGRYWVYVYKNNPSMDFVYDTKTDKRILNNRKAQLLIEAYNYERKQNNE